MKRQPGVALNADYLQRWAVSRRGGSSVLDDDMIAGVLEGQSAIRAGNRQKHQRAWMKYVEAALRAELAKKNG